MAIAFRGVGTAYSVTTVATSGTNITFTVNKPAGTVAGDLMIACMQVGGTANNASSLPSITGWTMLSLTYGGTGSGDPCTTAVFYRVAGASEPASWTSNPFQINGTQPAGRICQSIAYSGVDNDSPFIQSGGNGFDSAEESTARLGYGTDWRTPILYNYDASAWTVAFFAQRVTATTVQTVTAATGLTSRQTATSSSTDDHTSGIQDSNGVVAAGYTSYTKTRTQTSTTLNSAGCWLGIMRPAAISAGTYVEYHPSTKGQWVVPPGVTSVTAHCIGAGGTGGTASTTARAGGAGGTYARRTFTVSPGDVIDFYAGDRVGGGTGQTTWFKSNDANGCVANGGTVGSGTAAVAGTTTGAVGDVIYVGGSGGATATSSGGGGGGAGSTGAGGNASTSTAGTGTALYGGNGGAGVTATSGRGFDGPIPEGSTPPKYGGGGSGGRSSTSSGGYGARGVVIIEYTAAFDQAVSDEDNDVGVDIPVTNGDFENGFDGWTVPANPSWTITTTNPHSGTKCVRLTDGNGPSGVQKTDQPNEHWPAKPGDLWQMSGWFRNESFTGAGGLRLQARVNGSWTDMASTEAQSVGASWTQQSTVVTAVPANADAVMARIAFAGTGAICIDDLTLTRVGGPYAPDRASITKIVHAPQTDSGTGTDSASVSKVVTPLQNDPSSAATESVSKVSISGTPTQDASGAVAETVSKIAVSGTPAADASGATTEAGSVTQSQSAPATDSSGALTEAASVNVVITTSDSAVGAELVSSITVSGADDSAVGADGAYLGGASKTVGDTGEGAEDVLSLRVSPTAGEQATATDTGYSSFSTSGTDTSGPSQESARINLGAVADSGTGSENASVNAAIAPVADSTTVTEPAYPAIKVSPNTGDAAQGVEATKVAPAAVADSAMGADALATSPIKVTPAMEVATGVELAASPNAVVAASDQATVVEQLPSVEKEFLEGPRVIQVFEESRETFIEPERRSVDAGFESRQVLITRDLLVRPVENDVSSVTREVLVSAETRLVTVER